MPDTQLHFEHSLVGDLVGRIWMPAVECTKALNYNLTREDGRFIEHGTLRDHVLRATNDGDFQSCEIHGALKTVLTIRKGGRIYTRVRWTDLDRCKSVADMVCAEPMLDSADGDE
jgi:hypothetical protein